MKSKKSKTLLASSMIAKHFQEECKKRGLKPITKKEREQIQKTMDVVKENAGKNIYEEKSDEELKELRLSLLETRAIIEKDIKDGKDSKDSFRLTITNVYLQIVEKELAKRVMEGGCEVE